MYLFYFFLVSLVQFVIGSEILVVCPTGSFSHQQPFIVITKALIERNHTVTFITANPEKVPAHKNLTTVDLSFMYKFWKTQKDVVLEERKHAWKGLYTFGYIMTVRSSPLIMSHPNMQKFIKMVISTNKTYDLMILEYWRSQSLWGLGDLVGRPPVIGMSTLQIFTPLTFPFNNPENPSFVPQIWGPYTDEMNFWQRFDNTLQYIFSVYFHAMHSMSYEQEILDKYVGRQHFNRTLQEIYFDSSRNSLMTSADSRVTGFVRPVFPNIIEVGPLHLVEPKRLSPDLEEWFEGAEKGVIYFSLGSNMRGVSMGDYRRKCFLKAFEKLNGYRVLWKWENEDKMEGQSDNVMLRKWIPQQDVIAHPKIKLFIMQGGLQSLQEAFNYGVKTICIPIFGDQDLNCNRVAKIKTGILLEFEELNEKIISKALNTILTDPVYEENVKYYSKLSKDTPMKPIEKSMWWIEYVLRHKGVAHMQSHAAKLPYYQYYLLDIIALLLVIILSTTFIIYFILKKIILNILSTKENNKKLKKKEK